MVSPMDELASLHPDHVFLRREALEHGYDDRDLRTLVRAGVLSKVRHGAYVPATVWQAADDLGRHKLRARAVLRSHESALVLSHISAAVEHGLRLYRPDLTKVHVTCLEKPIGRTTPDVCYHRLPRTDAHLVSTDDGILMMTAVRAGLEYASMTTVAAGMVALDSVIDLGMATLDEVIAAYTRFRGPGTRRLQITVRLVRSGSNSVAESLSRHLFFCEHVPEPRLQFEVRDEHGVLIGRTDFAWPEYGVLGEFDGVGKYVRSLRRDETAEQAVVREKRREDLLREATGWLMIRLVWADLQRPARTAHRVREQLFRGQRLLAS